MKRIYRVAIFVWLGFFASDLLQAKFTTMAGDFEITLSGLFKPETFFGKNTVLLNSNNLGNKLWFQRHTIDLDVGIKYGEQTYGKSVADFYFNVRNKGVWGNAESVASTTDTTTKVVDAVARPHKHAIPRHIFWMRAAWLQFSLNEALNLPFDNEHYYKLGLFPFSLGRGIALGDAYAVGPEPLGFYTEANVDQYAPGGLLHGEFLEGRLSYDIYTAILRNRSTKLGETGLAILGQEYGRRETPQRGSGKINYLIATRLRWDAMQKNDPRGSLYFEPYALFNSDPEQRIEFLADASIRLGTMGFAGEFAHPRFEIGFDTAFNVGKQSVKGWDRNQVENENRNGQVVLVNSHVVDQTGKKIPYVKNSAAQTLIDCAPQAENQNSIQIGTQADGVGFATDSTELINSSNRFRNPYNNDLRGWMAMGDAAYNIPRHDLKLAVMIGGASGDDNPNNETMDGVYRGFIPLQEIYSGKRVKSAFVLGADKLTRPLSIPKTNQAPNKFSMPVNGFTNLVFYGNGLHWKPSNWNKKFELNVNGLAYWQQFASYKFDAETQKQLDEKASTYLGVELNVFMNYYLLKDLKLFFVGAVFFPGRHYDDVKGKPLDAEQKRILDRFDRTGFNKDRIPNLGNDSAYTFNLGLEFKF